MPDGECFMSGVEVVNAEVDFGFTVAQGLLGLCPGARMHHCVVAGEKVVKVFDHTKVGLDNAEYYIAEHGLYQAVTVFYGKGRNYVDEAGDIQVHGVTDGYRHDSRDF